VLVRIILAVMLTSSIAALAQDVTAKKILDPRVEAVALPYMSGLLEGLSTYNTVADVKGFPVFCMPKTASITPKIMIEMARDTLRQNNGQFDEMSLGPVVLRTLKDHYPCGDQ
jgi:hypothetical protein